MCIRDSASAAQIVKGSFLGRQDGAQERPDAPTWTSRRFLDEFGVPKRDQQNGTKLSIKNVTLWTRFGVHFWIVLGTPKRPKFTKTRQRSNMIGKQKHAFSIMLQGKSGRQKNLRERNSSSKRMLDCGAENGPKLAPFWGHITTQNWSKIGAKNEATTKKSKKF